MRVSSGRPSPPPPARDIVKAQAGYWSYHVIMGPATQRALKDALSQWHRLVHSRCSAEGCAYRQGWWAGVKYARAHPEVLANITLALDAEYLVRQERR